MALSPERRASNRLLREWCASVTGRVLSIGSGGDIDKEGGHYRDYFVRATEYVTSDIVPGCDLQLDAREMSAVEESAYHCVFCSGVLEHVDDPSKVTEECWRVLDADGLFIVGVPFKQPIHRAPHDFWRFTEFGLRTLLAPRFTVREMVPIGDAAFPFGYWALARVTIR